MIETPVSPIIDFLLKANIFTPMFQKQKNSSKVWNEFGFLLFGLASIISKPHKQLY